jgi:hypothetical protein
VEAAEVLPTMFQDLDQAEAMDPAVVKHLIKAEQHRPVTVIHDLVATAAPIQVVVVVTVALIMAPAVRASLS